MPTSLREIPGVGKRIEEHLKNIGISCVEDLAERRPEELYELDCAYKGFKEDPCALYVFRLAVYYAESPERDPAKLKWWYWKDKLYPPRD
ncbi:MAG TPA: Pathogenicity locus [Candidatus Caccocola faecipullorum]|nr:Pathogenicity locus [Candidatus Caccocola faecipullorum]